MPEIPAIEGFTDASDVRILCLQSGRQVHAPALAIGLQPLDATLTALAGLDATTGAVVQIGADTFTKMQVARSAGGRLTLTSGSPAPAADVTGATTLYYTPHVDNVVWLYNGTIWVAYAFSEVSLALGTLTANLPYDVFLYANAGVPTLELTAWSSDTARATTIVRQDGVFVRGGATTRRFVGTIRTTSTTTTEDSAANRYVSNRDNRVPKPMKAALETADTWNYTTATIRQANANTANQLNFVRCNNEDVVEAICFGVFSNTNAASGAVVIGLDSTSTKSSDCIAAFATCIAGAGRQAVTAAYKGYPGAGKHSLMWNEWSQAAGTTTWQGDTGDATVFQTGIIGTVLC